MDTKELEQPEEWEVKCVELERKLDEVVVVVNSLIINVNRSNKFIADLHNSLADAGMIKAPPKDTEGNEGEEPIPEEPEPEPEMDNVD
tara:strand:+ start:2494 stop:2757 length:264 start_codon:yes stop_codon:yes gene_type:complete